MDAVRIGVLICCCLLTFGSYFSYDIPGALTDDFRETLAQNNTSHQGLFYSLYSLPNTVQPFFGGLLIDKVLGLRLGASICCALVAIGCTIVAVSASVESWDGTPTAFLLALTGRFVFGLGGETLSVCQNAFCAKWFRGADLSTAFAIVLSFARVGSAVNFAIEPQISANIGFSFALWLSALFCFVSQISCFVLWFLDAKYESILDEDDDEAGNGENDDDTVDEDANQHHDTRLNGTLEEPLIGTNQDNDGRRSSIDVAELRNVSQSDTSGNLATPEKPRKKQETLFQLLLAVLGPREILIYLICVCFYIAVFIFIAVASKLLVDTYEEIDKVKAGLLVSIPYTVSAIVSPVLGLTMDRVGRGLIFVGIACASLCAVHLTFAFGSGKANPTLVMIWLGLTYSMCAASLWPMISLVVESRYISTAYGLMMSIQNTGLALAPVFIMKMLPSDHGDTSKYKSIELIFAGFAFAAFLCTVVLYFVDARHGGVLIAKANTDGLTGPSPRINPLRPSPSPYFALQARGNQFRPSAEARRVIAPKTPQAIRQQYFRRLRIQSHI